jgi:hypothetical protein
MLESEWERTSTKAVASYEFEGAEAELQAIVELCQDDAGKTKGPRFSGFQSVFPEPQDGKFLFFPRL